MAAAQVSVKDQLAKMLVHGPDVGIECVGATLALAADPDPWRLTLALMNMLSRCLIRACMKFLHLMVVPQLCCHAAQNTPKAFITSSSCNNMQRGVA